MFSSNEIQKTSAFVQKVDTEATSNDEDGKEWVLRKSYNERILVCVPAVKRSYLVICSDLFSKYVGDEPEKIYVWYIADFSVDYYQLNKINVQRQELNGENDTCTQTCIDLFF